MSKKTEEPTDIKDLTDEQLKSSLTEKQRLFLQEFLSNGFNGTKAALAIYATDDYSTAANIASENLKKPKLSELKRRWLEAKAMKADEALARLGSIARGDLGDFLEIQEDGTIKMTLQKAKQHGLTHLIKKVRNKRIPEKDHETGDILYTHDVQVELYSSHDALRDICRTLGLFTDNINAQIDGVVGVLKTGPDVDPEQWAKQIASYRQKVQEEMGF